MCTPCRLAYLEGAAAAFDAGDGPGAIGGAEEGAGPGWEIGDATYTTGWAAHTARARRERVRFGGAASRPYSDGRRGPARSRISTEDAFESLAAEAFPTDGDPVRAAALRLAAALDRAEERLPYILAAMGDDGDALPRLTPQDLRLFAADPQLARDPVALGDMFEAAGESVAAPPIEWVDAADDAGVLRLEAAVAPAVAQLESLRGAVAARLTSAAERIEAETAQMEAAAREYAASAQRSLQLAQRGPQYGPDAARSTLKTTPGSVVPVKRKRGRPPKARAETTAATGDAYAGEPAEALGAVRSYDARSVRVFGGKPSDTRGSEIDAAGSLPLSHFKPLLETDLVLNTARRIKRDVFAFSFDGEKITSAGVYYIDGILIGSTSELGANPSRTTRMTPRCAAQVAVDTSSRVCAWALVEGPEGRYLCRAKRGSRGAPAAVAAVDESAIVLAVREASGGSHKLPVDKYIEILQKAGLEVHFRPREGEKGAACRGRHYVRFDLVSRYTPEEIARERARALALSEADFRALDWRAFDREVRPHLCEGRVEIGGDLTLEGAELRVAKLRKGVAWSVAIHQRALITFHSHPYRRFRGAALEVPSDNDLRAILYGALHGSVWHLVAAPETVYVLRPTEQLRRQALEDFSAAAQLAVDVYQAGIADIASHAAAGGVPRVVKALADAGYVAYTRDMPKPCGELLGVPDRVPFWNATARAQYDAEVAALSRMSPQRIAAADWSQADEVAQPPRSLVLQRRRVVTHATWDGRSPVEVGGDAWPAHEDGQYSLSGPLGVAYHTDDGELPAGVPLDAIRASAQSERLQAWGVLLSPDRITVYRSREGALESFGPVPRARPAKSARPANSAPPPHVQPSGHGGAAAYGDADSDSNDGPAAYGEEASGDEACGNSGGGAEAYGE